MDEIILSMEVLRNQQKKLEKKMCDLMITKHPVVSGWCMHINDQAKVVPPIVYGTDTWEVNNYAKATLISTIQKKTIFGYEIDTLFSR